ncbi:MAG: hypothetical protein V1837_03420 [Candidatus Woesearchaeota archaeon]
MVQLTFRNWVAVGSTVVLGAMTKLYSGPYEEMVAGQAWDALAPVCMYNLFYDTAENDFLRAGIMFGSLCAIEFAQYLGIYGTYDPKDFAAYAVGTALAITLDKITRPSHKQSIDDVM